MERYAKCPKCNEYLEAEDCYDTDNLYDKFYCFYIGNCPNCKKQYRWLSIYKLDYSYNIQEIE